MTTCIIPVVICNECKAEFVGIRSSMYPRREQSLKMAARNGWKRIRVGNRWIDLCPACVAVKEHAV